MNIKALVKEMTVEEKVAQLCSLMAGDLMEDGEFSRRKMKSRLKHGIGFLASITRDLPPREGVQALNFVQEFLVEKTRLGIPAICHEECLHGVMASGSTVFPQAIGMAAGWNPGLLKRVAAAIGKEAKAWGFTLALSPVLDIGRDPRCGRIEETFGEDTLLVTRMALTFIRALQSKGVGCTPKHFVANFVGDGGRDSHDIHFSERELREVYFPPYEKCIKKGKAVALMPAYNSVNGVPVSCNPWLLKDVLRKEWGFEGIAGSDYWAIDNLQKSHGVAKDKAECAKLALEGGMDVEWPNSSCYPTLVRQVKQGRVSCRRLDEAVERVLRLKKRQGVFSNWKGDESRALSLTNCKAHRSLALEAAHQSVVLLKNTGILPLGPKRGTIAVIGPNANQIRTGGYSSQGSEIVTPLKGLISRYGKNRILFTPGCGNHKGTTAGIHKAARIAAQADAVILCVGNWSGGFWKNNPHTEGEGRDRSDLRLPGPQEELLDAVVKANRRTIVVLIGGSAVVMDGWVDRVPAILEMWYPGCEGGTALAEILSGDKNPGGKLPITFPRRNGQLPLYYNMKPSGRKYDYNDLRGDQAQFPFGHGLSYTRFDYASLNAKQIGKSGMLVSATITNSGKRDGDEVVQLYIRDLHASMTRPVKELKGFERIHLKAGQKQRVEFKLSRKDLSFLGTKMEMVFEPGELEVMIGSSSEDIRLRKIVSIG